MHYDWHFERILPYWQAFGFGVLITIKLTVVSLVLGVSAGTGLGLLMAKLNSSKTLQFFIDLIRSIPLLPLLLFFYYLLSKQIIGFSVSSFWVSVIALALSLAAFTADVIRSAVSSVPIEAVEAARSLGFSERQIARYIMTRYTIKYATPGMAVLVIANLKNSSLAAVINVAELTYVAQSVIAETPRSLEVWTIVGAVYIALVLPTTYAAKWLEKWARRGDREASNETSFLS